MRGINYKSYIYETLYSQGTQCVCRKFRAL